MTNRIARTRTPDVRSRILSRRGDVPAADPVDDTRKVVRKAKGGTKSLPEGDQFIIELLKAGRPPYQTFREGKYTHVSDIISKCARKIALVRRLGANHTPKQLLDGHALTFAQGDAIHDFIKKRFVQSHPTKVWAQWGCRCGETVTLPMLYSAIRPSDKCPSCGQIPREYVEVVLEDDEHEVVGSPDLLLYLEDYRAHYVTEVKSISKDGWESLTRPMPDHVIQGLFYWKLMESKGYPLIDQFSILYVKKEYTWQLPYKEFIVRPKEQMHRLDTFLEDLGVLAAARNPKNPLPIRVTCSTPDAPEAKQCAVCTTCFQIK